ncbi:3-hydroxyacyl-CoA dehydrogenase NAD-binding domain-containing protein [Amycolatopsis sp. La24]|uniref:3-hydroxyacyl-CoA dehydrogenase NAD-binding domain-containing protein n=1 Tax=Amycolatopsis sp. La24 TaxID=3028304 RepID=UPI0023B01799|nr:3-hydroxyacyl-CoA dehydrogenase NAD-binding domain-containing protein [Amycolatopsis sp. La24]
MPDASENRRLVRLEREGEIALLVIDNPPVNTGTAAVRGELAAALRSVAADDSVAAVVLIGAGRHFLSGSDLREFAGELAKPELPEVVELIERCRHPVVAALSGTTLGGGLELALACDARIAAPGGRVGLPEVAFGMLPGAGGTQRTLRLLPPSRVLELVTSGKALGVEQAAEEGLIDAIATGSLREDAVRLARRTVAKRLLRTSPVREEAPGALETAAVEAVAREGLRPAVLAAVSAVVAGVAAPAELALAHERAEFHRLRSSREAAARRRLFFARTEARKTAPARGRRSVGPVGVVGAGTMGAGIARAVVESGERAILLDRDAEVAERARAGIEEAWRRQAASGRLAAAEVARRRESLSAGSEFAALAEAGLVIEAVFEDYEAKANALAAVEAVVDPGIPLGTNTSYLDIDVLAARLADPNRLAGTHFFSPAHRSGVLEVVRGAKTGETATEAALALAAMLRKVPILAGASEGFVGNRVYQAYRYQCELLVEDGATPSAVDAALAGFGFAMGPFAVADLAGLDIAWRTRRRHDHGRDPRARYPDVADRLVEAGRLGQKTSAGWYRYAPGSRTPRPDPFVDRLVAESRRAKGITPREIPPEEILGRALLAMANESALVLEEGVAASPSDIDLLLTLGYGFPGHVGGIAFWTAGLDPAARQRGQRRLAEATGHGFRAGDLALLR